MDARVEDIEAVVENIENITSVYKSIMFPDSFGADVELPPELALAFGEFADACRDFIEIYKFYQDKPTPEEEAATFAADISYLDFEDLSNDYIPVLDIVKGEYNG